MSRLLRRGAVEAKVGFSRATIYALMKDEAFPRPIKIGKAAVAWDEAEIDRWIEERRAETAARSPVT